MTSRRHWTRARWYLPERQKGQALSGSHHGWFVAWSMAIWWLQHGLVGCFFQLGMGQKSKHAKTIKWCFFYSNSTWAIGGWVETIKKGKLAKQPLEYMRMSTVNHQYLDHVILMSIERIQTWVTAETVQLRPQDPAHFATYLPSHSPKDCCGNFMGIWWCNNGFGIFWDIWITSGVLVLLGATASLRFLGPARSRSAPCELIPQRIAPIWLSLWACDLRRAFFPCPRFRQRLVWDLERTKETSRMLPLSDFVSGKTLIFILLVYMCLP